MKYASEAVNEFRHGASALSRQNRHHRAAAGASVTPRTLACSAAKSPVTLA
jgi:hypothetical protein